MMILEFRVKRAKIRYKLACESILCETIWYQRGHKVF